MPSRLALVLVPLALLTSACGQAQDAAATVRDCAGLASDVASSGLGGVPTRAEAEAALARLDERVAGLDSPDVSAAATDLRDRLRELVEATRTGDPAAAQAAADRARTSARSTAEACGLPAGQFLGG